MQALTLGRPLPPYAADNCEPRRFNLQCTVAAMQKAKSKGKAVRPTTADRARRHQAAARALAREKRDATQRKLDRLIDAQDKSRLPLPAWATTGYWLEV